VLLPMLQAQALMLDRVVLSHRDSDHVGGAASVLALQPQAQLWSSLEDGHPLLQVRESMRCQAGESWDWDGVHFEFLHPTPEAYVAQPALKPNALSCVLRMQSGGGRTALLVGDIEKPQELQLIARAAQDLERASLAADLLLVPHHGSKTSSSAEFLSAVHPQTVVVQAGYRNRYGHPAAPVVQRYRDLGQTYAPEAPMQWVDSAHCGAFLWKSWEPSEGICARMAQQRYWHHVAP
jgi:competence protein ComEC